MKTNIVDVVALVQIFISDVAIKNSYVTAERVDFQRVFAIFLKQ